MKIKLRPSTVEGQPASLYYLLRHEGRTTRITTGERLFADQWNAKRQCVEASALGRSHLGDVQRKIESDRHTIEMLIEALSRSQRCFSVHDIAAAFRARGPEQTFLGFLDAEREQLREKCRYGTARNYYYTRRSFAAFLEGGDVGFLELTTELIGRYESWLRQRHLTRNTVSFYMRILRSVYNKAAERGVVAPAPLFRRVYTGVDRTGKRAVGEEIVRRLRTLDLSDDGEMALVRDLFLFSFYTRGMAFVDMAYLTRTDLRQGVLHYVRRKTGSEMRIRMEPCMEEIVARYDSLTHDSQRLLPILPKGDGPRIYTLYENALNRFNKQLKRLSLRLELNVPLTTYVARHTWATLARNKQIPVSVISASMGHASEHTTRIYLTSLEASVVDEANRCVLSDI